MTHPSTMLRSTLYIYIHTGGKVATRYLPYDFVPGYIYLICRTLEADSGYLFILICHTPHADSGYLFILICHKPEFTTKNCLSVHHLGSNIYFATKPICHRHTEDFGMI